MNFYLNWSKNIKGLYLCATTANSSLQTSSIILAAFGWAPSTPLCSCPLATFALSSLCLLTIESLRAFDLPKMIEISQNIGYEIFFYFISLHHINEWILYYLVGDSCHSYFSTRFLGTLIVNTHCMVISKTSRIAPFIVKLLKKKRLRSKISQNNINK